MRHLDEKTLDARREKLKKKLTYDGITREAYDDKLDNMDDVDHLMTFENDAVILHLENLINTYGISKVSNQLNKLIKLKKVG